MSSQRLYLNRLRRNYPLFKYIDIYDKNSFLRQYLLDNFFICTFVYIVFYFAVWYAHKVIQRVEIKNVEMFRTVQSNRQMMDEIKILKNKRREYEEIVVKAKGSQNMLTKQMDTQIKKINGDLTDTETKLQELESFLSKWKFWKTCTDKSESKSILFDAGDDLYGFTKSAIEETKILEPSFAPPNPEPPPRKFGVFARPPRPPVPIAVAKQQNFSATLL